MTGALIVLLTVAATAFGTALGWVLRSRDVADLEDKAFWVGFRQGRDPSAFCLHRDWCGLKPGHDGPCAP